MTASQVLTKTAKRWQTIAHLPPEIRKYLMKLPDQEFIIELNKLTELDRLSA